MNYEVCIEHNCSGMISLQTCCVSDIVAANIEAAIKVALDDAWKIVSMHSKEYPIRMLYVKDLDGKAVKK